MRTAQDMVKIIAVHNDAHTLFNKHRAPAEYPVIHTVWSCLWAHLILVAGLLGTFGLVSVFPVEARAQEELPIEEPRGQGLMVGTVDTPEGIVASDSGEPQVGEEVTPALRAHIAQLNGMARDVGSLIAGDLHVDVEADSLFDVDIMEQKAVLVEAQRLRAVVERAAVDDAEEAALGRAVVADVVDHRLGGARREGASGAGGDVEGGKLDSSGAEASTSSETVHTTVLHPVSVGGDRDGIIPSAPIDRELWSARINLDRARLQFYELPKKQRDAIIDQHLERQRLAGESQAESGLDEAERKAREAEAARIIALEEAQRARSEAERLVAEEMARLLDISRSYADFETLMVRSRLGLKERAEQTLTLRRRVRETLARKLPEPVATDLLYNELLSFLANSRSELAKAISESFAESRVSPVEDALGALPPDVDRTQVNNIRIKLEATHLQLVDMESTYRRDHADQLYEEARALNSDRLSLLQRLSPGKKDNVTGYSSAGLDQSAAELQQIGLVLRYHLVSARRWLEDLGSSKGGSIFTTSFTAIKWLVLIFVFWWWRRRGTHLLEGWRGRLYEEQQRARAPEPTPLYRVLGFVQQTRRPLEWLILGWMLVWALPEEVSDRIEVQLITITFTWILAGAMAVSMIDTIAGWKSWLYLEVFRGGRGGLGDIGGGGDSYGRGGGSGSGVNGGRAGAGAVADSADSLRLRSLQFVGRTVVVVGLILSLSARLVGKGTIYGWIFSICWFAAIPVVLVIIGWWRGIIFERISAVRKKNPFHEWVIAHQAGWKSFPAAVSAGVYLFTVGAIRVIRGWLTRFDVTRRAHAYLFRRGMDRLAQEKKSNLVLQPLEPSLFAQLGPETESQEDVPGSLDEKLNEVVAQIARHGGGVFAVAGERGRGKTTVLRRVGERSKDIIFLECPLNGLEGLRQMLAAQLNMSKDSTLEECAAQLDGLGANGGILIDHAHRLVQPVMGGLAPFDKLMQIARANSSQCAWVLAFNEAIWRFLERARGARPMFDDVVTIGVWREEEIIQLIKSRCRQVGIDPVFDHILEKAPADGDEDDRATALERVVNGYYRLIWDYSVGNAGVALHIWRSSLGVDMDGQVIVKLFQVPDPRELEQIPDYAVFVLRAVIQLEPALPADVVKATMLGRARVEDLLRYGVSHGYFEESDGRYRVTWGWFRPITKFLQRRHLLSKG